jgi:hypothetical protein
MSFLFNVGLGQLPGEKGKKDLLSQNSGVDNQASQNYRSEVYKRRQAVLDANFQTYLDSPGAVPDDIPGSWHIYNVALAAHSIHFGGFGWPSYKSMGENDGGVIPFIKRRTTNWRNIIKPDDPFPYSPCH